MDAIFSSKNYAHAKQLLNATALQHKALSSNIANNLTPGYKRVELNKDFYTQLNAASKTGTINDMRAIDPALVIDTKSKTMTPDGNNVDIDRELLEMNKTTVQYQTVAQFISGSIKHLNTAITGRTS